MAMVVRSQLCLRLQPLIMRRFIIDGIITLPIALYGFLVFPNVPATADVFYISETVKAKLTSGYLSHLLIVYLRNDCLRPLGLSLIKMPRLILQKAS